MAARASKPRPSTTGHARDYVGIALDYARAAVADRGQKEHCKWVRLAAKRQLDDLKKQRRRDWPYRWSDWHANDVCDFIEKLPHVEGVWSCPTIVLEPFQIFVLTCVFGWRRKDDEDVRRFSVVYEELARKNAKSTKTAGVSLYALCCEGEEGPQVLTAATTYDQAKKVFHPAKRMVEKLPELQEAFGITPWAKSISSAMNGGYMQPIHAKSKTQDGHNPHCVTMDELHAHEDRGLYDVMRSAFGARRNPLLWQITTAGFNVHGVCYDQRTLATKILEGTVQAEHFFAIIYTLDRAEDYTPARKRDDDPYDPAVWIKANPLLASKDSKPLREEIAKAAIEAKNGHEGDYKTKRMNMWLGAASAWLNAKRWGERGDAKLRLRDFKGLDCTLGADFSDKDDITSVCLAALTTDNVLLIKTWHFVPEAALERESQSDRENTALYRKWRDQGKLIVTPGDMIEKHRVKRLLLRLIRALGIRRTTCDQWGSAMIISEINDEVASVDEPVAFIMPKTAGNVTPAAKEIEARVRAKAPLIRHDDNPVMNWMVGNAVAEHRVNGSLLPKKPKGGSKQKIDGVDAAINAVAPLVATNDNEGSVYDERPMLVV